MLDALLILTALLVNPATSPSPSPADGGAFEVLFDGTPESAAEHLRGYKRDGLPEQWQVVDGALTLVGRGGGDLVTKQTYRSFDLRLQWKISEGGNSGVFYGIAEEGEHTRVPYTTGLEMQLLDDDRHPDGRNGRDRLAGALYDLIDVPDPSPVRPVGEWNDSRVLVQGDRIRHFLNDRVVADVTLGSDEWNELLANSKFAEWPRFAKVRDGHIGLQDHGDEVAFRDIKVRRLDDSGATGNPIAKGWYADPEGVVMDGRYWVFPTYSAPYNDQMHFDAFSSTDLANWTKHERVLTADAIQWARRAMWAPSNIEKDGKFYFFFAANDIQRGDDGKPDRLGGIGVAVADQPEGPYRDLLGKPLLDTFHNGAQPIDQFVYKDPNSGDYLMYYGGWGHCNVVRLNDDFTGFVPWEDGETFKEITPQNYVEGPVVFFRDGRYYFLWSEGGWTNSSYRVAYATSDSPTGPFERRGEILTNDESVARGAGHNSVINVPGTDEYYIVYHRRPLGETDANSRETCIDRLEFDADGAILPVKMTFTGVEPRPMPSADE